MGGSIFKKWLRIFTVNYRQNLSSNFNVMGEMVLPVFMHDFEEGYLYVIKKSKK